MAQPKNQSKKEQVPEKKVEQKKENGEKPQQVQTVWQVQINKFGDLHFRKAMLESLKLTSKLEALQNLTMTYRPGCITIVAEAKTA